MEKLLDVFDLYADSDGRKINNFKNKLLSTMDVTIETNKPKIETMWINMMEDTLVYIENILKEPKRLIVNEEEIVKIEKIKKVTVESIKHLSKNAGFIEDVKEKSALVFRDIKKLSSDINSLIPIPIESFSAAIEFSKEENDYE